MFEFINKILKWILGDKSTKDIRAMMPIVEQIKEQYAQMQDLTNDELRNKTVVFRQRIAEHLAEIDADIKELQESTLGNLDLDPEIKEERYTEIDKLKEERDTELEVVLKEILPEAFAVVKETARRFSENDKMESSATTLDQDLAINKSYLAIEEGKAIYNTSWEAAGSEISWNMVHYDVQLIGGIALHEGKAAEMATGEGKTLVATLPAYLNGLSGQGVHVITVNNYLAKRDCDWMMPIFNFLGLTVDCIDLYRPHSPERHKAYRADITYGTNNEFGFDYLRDNMVRRPDEIVQRKHHFAMIDEVDSVLIDDARTPLIISGPVEKGDQQEFDFLKPRIEKVVAAQRKLLTKKLVDAKKLIAAGKKGEKEGEGGLALLRAQRGLPKNKALIKYLSEPGVKKILLDTENFYLQEQAKRMPEVDAAMYFVIEEKNNAVDLTDKGIELITGAGEDPDFFIMPDMGSEIAEIDQSDASEEEKQLAKDKLLQNFAIKSERLHAVQQLLKAYTLFEKDVEYIVVDDKVKIVDEQTGRVMDGRRYSDGLHQAIEAKESVKIEAATQTFATITLQNFFRMYHKLSGMTGTAETEAGEFWEIYDLDVVVIPTNRPIARDDREDLVYRTVRAKFNAVIEEIETLRNEGRPILVGTTSVETSELLSKLLLMKGIKHNVLNAKQHAREADIVAAAGQTDSEGRGNITIATNMAGRGTDIKLGEGVKEAGGLAIIGTERHDARRVDRQLRGRAGRQGDPGASQFFVSLEDHLMRLFGSDRIAKVMDRLGLQEEEVIQNPMITKSIARAQKKVEENNFGIRKRLLDYDEVMNKQRKVIYTKRRHALFGERLSVDLNNSFQDFSEDIAYRHREDASDPSYEDFKTDVIRYFAIATGIEAEEFDTWSAAKLSDQLFEEVGNYYKRKSEAIMRMAQPIIKDVYENKGQTVKRIIVPFTDGSKGLQIVADLEEAYKSDCRSIVKELEKAVSLAYIDDAWKVHLREMDELKQAVQTATYEQKDPLLIYKGESFKLFQAMLLELSQDIATFLFRAQIPVENSSEVKEAKSPRQTDRSKMQESRAGDLGGATGNAQRRAGEQAGKAERKENVPVRRKMPKVGRNEPCPCGSGKKFKQCHGKLAAKV